MWRCHVRWMAVLVLREGSQQFSPQLRRASEGLIFKIDGEIKAH